MGRVNEKYQPQNIIAVLGRMLNFKVLQDKLATFSKPSSLLGIDMNDQFMSLIELTSDHEGLKVISYAMEQLPLNTIINGDIKQPEIVNEYLVNLLRKASTKTKKIAIAVSGSSVITKVITMAANASDDDLEAKIIADADKYIPYALDEVAIDFSVLKEGDEESEILLAACRKEIIDQRVELLSAVGLEPSIVDIRIYDVERSFLLLEKEYLFNSNEVIALFEHNTGLSLTVMQQGVAIYHKEESFISEEASANINSTIAANKAELLELVSDEGAEEYKRQLAQQMKSAMQFFLSSSQYEKIDRIFLAGGFVSIKELAAWLDEWLKIPTRVANPLHHIALAETVDHQDIRDNAASLLVACGLAMRGLACP